MKEKLPHSTLALVMGILSIITCCFWGLPSIILGVVGFLQGKKGIAIHNGDPETYQGVGNAKAGKVTAIIGIILGLIMFAFTIYAKMNPDFEIQIQEWIEEMQAQQ